MARKPLESLETDPEMAPLSVRLAQLAPSPPPFGRGMAKTASTAA
jgi:hypothetical protein